MASDKDGIVKRDGSILSRLLGDKPIWGFAILMFLLSIVLIYSSTSSLANSKDSSNWAYLISQVKLVFIGFIILFAAYMIPLKWYRTLSIPVFYISIVLLAITVFFGIEHNEARRWLRIPFTSIEFQTSELVKITLVLFLAKVLEKKNMENFKSYCIWILIPVGVVCVLCAVGSISTALFIAMLSMLILIIHGIKWSHLWKTIGIAFITCIALVGVNALTNTFPRINTAVKRMSIHVKSDKIAADSITTDIYKAKMAKRKQNDAKFQSNMAKAAIADGKILGKGPGCSTQRYILPEAHSDFIFCIIVEEYGLLGASLLVILYVGFFARCVSIVKRCKRVFSSITVAGIAISFMAQAVLHIFVNIGILPVTGHTLPFISLGGTSFLVSSLALGIILSISRTLEVVKS